VSPFTLPELTTYHPTPGRFDELVDEDFRRNATRYLQSGTHSATIAGRMDFHPDEFPFDGVDVGTRP